MLRQPMRDPRRLASLLARQLPDLEPEPDTLLAGIAIALGMLAAMADDAFGGNREDTLEELTRVLRTTYGGARDQIEGVIEMEIAMPPDPIEPELDL